jgi:hypothetical protein
MHRRTFSSAAGPRGSGTVWQSFNPLIAGTDLSTILIVPLALIGTGMDPATALMAAPIDTETAYPRPFRGLLDTLPGPHEDGPQP